MDRYDTPVGWMQESDDGEWVKYSDVENYTKNLEACQKKAVQQLKKENADMRKSMREIYEVWAGSEGIVETTAPEAYMAHLIREMRDIASKFLKEQD